ncbi:Farnesyltransferase/geranylgeranyltransferase type-1 subunit alpha [Fulvia fulva]|uniref:Protein farnesyltransferase/geranylgeranyltransferase type-1 subunit alpha n=1 Tax=Passalora fulva TaxID=5499 RepID=A0A9Q8LEW4_PASFU|nr:Farnesyltransferase/geranylgeranyltransferase type-1 subunit alpha [Fulvia fulva]KAK4615721.1 Farnesyltransferase/geranylgeranyltransferase type-1 subunit alpha [Fulvia fulva]KAK4617007.1 Farnesyltransferase/geranylgeranyltransferase type-1 subunit alpha [Fulvia fulva]UJO16129.1 Farnesyltransferase/geranylgeranyltransferase type-1 subunit alpha [Fulvia fulva]WPV18782.1 Farnesyltransferase/geranylgeranyltransferase type-1 subunit alpha [Fulvia fulva]WPV34113.1 Farnesyltransferase/geranylgera
MGKYADDPQWADIAPLPTDEGGPNPLAAIAYSDEYGETMSYLRAVMAANEYSERVLALTEDLIDMNPAHYTVWLYRAQTLFALDKDLNIELQWLSETALQHQKNYQIWHHRNLIVDRLGQVEGEAEFVESMFDLDAKNYHVWSYRQWLVKRFGLWESGELDFTERMMAKDIRNNSAWNHRWYIVNGREEDGVKGVTDPTIAARELELAKKAIAKAPQNQSPWSYLRGIIKKTGQSLKEWIGFAEQYADVSQPAGIRSSHALHLLADALAEEEATKQQASDALDLLSKTYDPIRKNYWEYRKGLLGLPATSAAAVA